MKTKLILLAILTLLILSCWQEKQNSIKNDTNFDSIKPDLPINTSLWEF